MRFVLLCATIVAAVPACAQTINEFRENFMSTFGDECLRTQRAAPGNSGVSDDIIVKYCGCMSRHAPEFVTMDDIMEIARTGQRGRELQKRLNAAGEACAAWIRGEVVDGPIGPKDRR